MISLELLQNIYELDRTYRDILRTSLCHLDYRHFYDEDGILYLRYNPHTRHHQTFYLGMPDRDFTMYENAYHGTYIEYYPHGNPKKIVTYDHGILHGPATYFFENGTLFMSGAYHKGKKEGLFVSYHKDAFEIRESVSYHKGKIIHNRCG